MKKKVLILGGTGMLGHKLVQIFSTRFETWYSIRGEFSEIAHYGIFDHDRVVPRVSAADFRTVESAIASVAPDVVVNAIGIIKQVATSKDVVQTLTINSILPQLIGELSAREGFRFITLGTDCVFSGSKGSYSETDVPDALDLYGRSKQFGEVVGPNCLTLRTSIIGRELKSSRSLIEWFLGQKDQLQGYANAVFSGFPTIVLAEILAGLIDNHPTLRGLFHVSSDPISKYDLLFLVKQKLGLSVELEKDTDFCIDRSLDSTRFRDATGFEPLPWKEMVDRMVEDPTPYERWRSSREL